MRRWCRRVALPLLAALAAGAAPLEAQSVSLAISGIVGDSVSPAPVMTVTGLENRPELGPYVVAITVSLDAQFRTPFYNNAVEGEVATFTLDSLLPERTIAYFRVTLSTASGAVVAQKLEQHPVRGWLRLISPNRGPTTVVATRTPRFIWSSPPITFRGGLWVYDIDVINTRTGNHDFSRAGLNDTSIVFDTPLESNASYHWQVHARTQSGPPSDQITIQSQGTFVIAASPTATVFYNNFPNPFGQGTRSELTCFWFELAHTGTVKLAIYDIRMREVRRIIPAPSLSGSMTAGSYGRENVNATTGCDERFAWDGRDARGRFVLPGVYVAVFEGDGVRQTTKISYRGP